MGQASSFLSSPIAILGFGRSGTTWASDILSKAIGGLVLFEPLHREMGVELAKELCYCDAKAAEDASALGDLLSDVLAKRFRNRWLLRNHVPWQLEVVSDELVETIWRQCEVLGFKEIRANFLAPWLVENLDARVVFLIRHPCAVLSSIERRKNFWEEFGWAFHRRAFWDRVINGSLGNRLLTDKQRRIIDSASGRLEETAVMWGVTHVIARSQLQALGMDFCFYENLYDEPFGAARKMLDSIGLAEVKLHPAHLFTPSMTTLRTTHGMHDQEDRVHDRGAAVFWDGVLDDDDVSRILEITRGLGVLCYDESGFPR